MKKRVSQFLGLAFLLLTTNTVLAQSPVTSSTNEPSTSAASQTVLSALATLPEADTLIFVNPHRILNDAAPRIMPAKDLAAMREGFGQMKQHTGVDPTKLDYLVIAVRFRKPSADLSFNPPEVMAVAGGDFSADSLIVLAKGIASSKMREEAYGAKTLSLVTIDPIAQEAEKNPLLKSFSEIAIVPINASTIAVGTPGYLKAAVDASGGTGRISAESLSSLLRDPNALVSVAGSPLTSFIKSFGLLGTESNPREPRCDSKFGDFYGAVTMDETKFMARGALHADNPDTAKILNGLISGMLRQVTRFIPDEAAKSAMQGLSISPQDNEVVLHADIPHQVLINFIKQQMQPKKQEASAPPKATTKPAVRKRRPRK